MSYGQENWGKAPNQSEEVEQGDNISVDPTPLFRQPPRMQSLDYMRLLSPSPSQPCEESVGSSDALLTPQVKNEAIPKMKQQFDNLEEVRKFYNNYAREAGFRTRIHSSKTGKNGETLRKEFVCYKEGVMKNSAATKRRRGSTREGCGAKLSIVKNKSGKGFVVSQFVEGHNHLLTMPKKVPLLKSCRRVSGTQKALTRQLVAANVPTCEQTLDRHDAIMLYEYFEYEQEKHGGFRFTFERDAEGRMTRCFWADATCRKSYRYFGDVVMFDTVYNTNRYSLIFTPILGVNHHRQTTLFGCAFLSDETSDSFEWLFKQWLKAMPAGPPKMIITAQDPAMTKAIASALPNTFHSYCIWDIVDKFSEKIGAQPYGEHYDEFQECIWNSESIEEFESRWVDVVGKSKLSNNEWLQGVYKIRDKWIPAYTNRIFSAQMTSCRRDESHSFFKKCVSELNSFLDFVTRFDWALSPVRQNELDFDNKDTNEKPDLKTSWPLEKKMSELYTWSVFEKFQTEVFQIGAYVLTIRHEDEHRCLWNVQKWDVQQVEMEVSRLRELSVEKSSNHVSCSCKMFEFDGIPCRHILAYFFRKQIMELPTNYILQRWTKKAKAGRVVDFLGSAGKEIYDNPVLARRHLFELASYAIDEAVLSEKGTQYLQEALELAIKKITEMRSSRKEGVPAKEEFPSEERISFLQW